MVYNDEFTLSLMQNKGILEINQNSHAGHEVYRMGDEIVWTAKGEKGVSYLAQFNVGEESLISDFDVAYLGIDSDFVATELWTGEVSKNRISSDINPHGVCLYKICL